MKRLIMSKDKTQTSQEPLSEIDKALIELSGGKAQFDKMVAASSTVTPPAQEATTESVYKVIPKADPDAPKPEPQAAPVFVRKTPEPQPIPNIPESDSGFDWSTPSNSAKPQEIPQPEVSQTPITPEDLKILAKISKTLDEVEVQRKSFIEAQKQAQAQTEIPTQQATPPTRSDVVLGEAFIPDIEIPTQQATPNTGIPTSTVFAPAARPGSFTKDLAAEYIEAVLKLEVSKIDEIEKKVIKDGYDGKTGHEGLRDLINTAIPKVRSQSIMYGGDPDTALIGLTARLGMVENAIKAEKAQVTTPQQQPPPAKEKPGKLTVFLDVDGTLCNTEGYNDQFIDALVAKGIKNVTLMTSMGGEELLHSIEGLVSEKGRFPKGGPSRTQLIEHLKSKGITVDAVVTPLDQYVDSAPGSVWKDKFVPLIEEFSKLPKEQVNQVLKYRDDIAQGNDVTNTPKEIKELYEKITARKEEIKNLKLMEKQEALAQQRKDIAVEAGVNIDDITEKYMMCKKTMEYVKSHHPDNTHTFMLADDGASNLRSGALAVIGANQYEQTQKVQETKKTHQKNTPVEYVSMDQRLNVFQGNDGTKFVALNVSMEQSSTINKDYDKAIATAQKEAGVAKPTLLDKILNFFKHPIQSIKSFLAKNDKITLTPVNQPETPTDQVVETEKELAQPRIEVPQPSLSQAPTPVTPEQLTNSHYIHLPPTQTMTTPVPPETEKQQATQAPTQQSATKPELTEEAKRSVAAELSMAAMEKANAKQSVIPSTAEQSPYATLPPRPQQPPETAPSQTQAHQYVQVSKKMTDSVQKKSHTELAKTTSGDGSRTP